MMRQYIATACMLLATGLLTTAHGQGADPTGTWKWEWAGRDGQSRTATLKLKLEGDSLTGSTTGRDGEEIEIQDASFKDNTVAFKVTRRFNDREFTQTYSGKLDGESIKGTIKFERQGEPVEREWAAKRS